MAGSSMKLGVGAVVLDGVRPCIGSPTDEPAREDADLGGNDASGLSPSISKASVCS